MLTELQHAPRQRAARAQADREWLVRCYRLAHYLPASDVAVLCALRGQVLRRLDILLPPPDERRAMLAELEDVLTLAERIAAERRELGEHERRPRLAR